MIGPPPKIKICSQCGAEYKGAHPFYCSPTCRDRAHFHYEAERNRKK